MTQVNQGFPTDNIAQILPGPSRKGGKNMEQKLVPLDPFEKWEEMHSRSQVFLAL